MLVPPPWNVDAPSYRESWIHPWSQSCCVIRINILNILIDKFDFPFVCFYLDGDKNLLSTALKLFHSPYSRRIKLNFFLIMSDFCVLNENKEFSINQGFIYTPK